MENTKKKPQVRFKGFTDDWEQCTLKDVSNEIIAGGDIKKDKLLKKGKYPVIANALTNDGIVGYYKNEYKVKAPAITITGRGDIGHAQARTINFTPVVRLLTIKTKHDIKFLENGINILDIMQESTGVPQLTIPQLGNYKIFFPKSLIEENKIGKYFETLDKSITLYQRKDRQKKKKGKKIKANLHTKQERRRRTYL